MEVKVKVERGSCSVWHLVSSSSGLASHNLASFLNLKV